VRRRRGGAEIHHLLSGLIKLKAEFKFIKDVRGSGLLQAIEFDRDIAKGLALLCLEQGLIVNNLKPDLVRLMPPLIVQPADIEKALRLLKRALKKASANLA
jgi:acetylornithine/succinyldiaminopimelate/putrescine aminotransferase